MLIQYFLIFFLLKNEKFPCLSVLCCCCLSVSMLKSALGCGYVGPLCVTHLTNWAEHWVRGIRFVDGLHQLLMGFIVIDVKANRDARSGVMVASLARVPTVCQTPMADQTDSQARRGPRMPLASILAALAESTRSRHLVSCRGRSHAAQSPPSHMPRSLSESDSPANQTVLISVVFEDPGLLV